MASTPTTGTPDTAPSRRPASSPTATAAADDAGDAHRSPVDVAVTLLTAPVAVARRVLPSTGTPVYLAAGAAAVAGVIELPAAAGIGLAYLALRRWQPAAATTNAPDLPATTTAATSTTATRRGDSR